MEDRLKKVLQKKAVKNNFKNIETLPTLNTNLPPSTSSSSAAAAKPDSSTVESIPVAVDATPIAVTVEDDVDLSGNSTDTTTTKEGFGGRTDRKWGQRITIAFSVAITMAIILYGVLFLLFKKGEKFSFTCALAGFILFFISLLFGKECGFKTVTFDDFKSPLRVPGALTNLLGAVLYAPYCVLRLVAKVMAILFAANESPSKTKNYREKVNHDADWITNSACEFFSIPLAYAFTCVLYFASDGPCARPGDLFASDILNPIFNKIFLPFSYIGPMLVYTIYGVYLPKFISFIGLEKIGKFFFLFIISWIMVYFFLPFLISSLLGVFQFRANPMIYIFILLGFVLFLATPDVDEIRRWSTYTWKYLIVLLLHLILVLILAPLTQVFFSIYVMYYFYSCQVKVSRLNIDLYPNPTNFFQKLFNVRPDDILKSKTSNFLWMAYLIFFLWKIAELVMGHYNVPKINGVKLTGSFVANLILSVIAVIILFWLASSSGGSERMEKVILSTAKGLGRYTDQGTTSQSAALALLIFETYQMMTPEEKVSDNNEKKPSYVKNKIYEAIKLDSGNKDKNIDDLNTEIKGKYDTVKGYFYEFDNSLWEWSKYTNTPNNIYNPDDKKKSEEDRIRDYLQDTIEFFNKINDDTKVKKYRINEKEAIPKRIKRLKTSRKLLNLTNQPNKANEIDKTIELLDNDLVFLKNDTKWDNTVKEFVTPRNDTIDNYNLIFPTYQQNQDDKNENRSLNRNALLENKSILKYLIDKIKEFSKTSKSTDQSKVIAYKRYVPDDVPDDVSNNDTVDINDVKVSDINDNDAVVGNTVVGNTESDNIIMTKNPISISQNNDEDDKNRGERMMEAVYGPEKPPPIAYEKPNDK